MLNEESFLGTIGSKVLYDTSITSAVFSAASRFCLGERSSSFGLGFSLLGSVLPPPPVPLPPSPVVVPVPVLPPLLPPPPVSFFLSSSGKTSSIGCSFCIGSGII